MSEAASLLGVRVDRKSLAAATADALAAVDKRGPPVVFACANPHALVTAQTDAAFRSALNNATAVVADGVGVILMGRVAGMRVGPRITGSDYFASTMAALNARGGASVFFFGSTSRVLTLVAERLRRDYPNVALRGTLSPPFGSWSAGENDAMLATINDASPDVLWVGMTAPKQEKWVEANRHRLDAAVIGSVGAVFDFYAGTYPRAPRWMRAAGIEWLYRLISEPRRMWRRTVLSVPRFIWLVLWQHVLRQRRVERGDAGGPAA